SIRGEQLDQSWENVLVFAATQLRAALLGDDRVVWEAILEGAADQRLGAEIGDRHRASIGLVEAVAGSSMCAHDQGKPRCFQDCFERRSPFVFSSRTH